MNHRATLGGFATAALVLGLASPALGSSSEQSSVADALEVVADATRHQTDAEMTDVLGNTADIPGGESISTIEDVPIAVPASLGEPVVVGEGSEAVGIRRPGGADSPLTVVKDGVSAHSVTDSSQVVTAVKDDSTVQIATLLQNATAPERYDYVIDVPEGARLELRNGQPFIWATDGSLIGGFFPAWAVDAEGRDVPTRYEVEGNTLTQVVLHRAASSVAYPILADPAHRRGMIDQVKWERWANGGWEVRLTVTPLARFTQPVNPAIVYTEGLADLREHHPRSMAYRTMAQQWDCHVVGLPGTVNIDLESYRRSWDGWRSGIGVAVIRGNPAKACNW